MASYWPSYSFWALLQENELFSSFITYWLYSRHSRLLKQGNNKLSLLESEKYEGGIYCIKRQVLGKTCQLCWFVVLFNNESCIFYPAFYPDIVLRCVFQCSDLLRGRDIESISFSVSTFEIAALESSQRISCTQNIG